MNDDKKIISIFAQAYLLLAEASKQLPTLEGFLLMLELLGEDGIQECAKVADLGPQAVAQAMVLIIKQKSALKAANGAKLRYIMQLLGKCQPGYLKKGGRCKPCEKAEGVRDKDGKLRGTKEFPRKLPGVTVTSETSKKKLDGGSLFNRIYSKWTKEGVNGVGTRFNPVELNNVDVYGFNRNAGDLKHTRITSTYTQSPGYKKLSDYLLYPNGQFFERSIDITPNGNDTTYSTWHYPYNPRYSNIELMKGSNFDRLIDAASSHDIKNGVVKSIPFFRETKHLKGERYSK